MSDELPAIGLRESYLMQEALWKVHHLSDMGIGPISTWRVEGKCSRHGQQYVEFETTDLEPAAAGAFLRCEPCLYDHGVTKWLSVLEVRKV